MMQKDDHKNTNDLTTHKRRHFLGLIGTSSLVSVAGCNTREILEEGTRENTKSQSSPDNPYAVSFATGLAGPQNAFFEFTITRRDTNVSEYSSLTPVHLRVDEDVQIHRIFPSQEKNALEEATLDLAIGIGSELSPVPGIGLGVEVVETINNIESELNESPTHATFNPKTVGSKSKFFVWLTSDKAIENWAKPKTNILYEFATPADETVRRRDLSPIHWPVCNKTEQPKETVKRSEQPKETVKRSTTESAATTQTLSSDGTFIDDFEAGSLDNSWKQPNKKSVSTGRDGFEIQSEIAPQGNFALRGLHEKYDKYSAIERSDFTIDRDNSDLRLYVKLGPVLNASERANKISFLGQDKPLIIVDQKDRSDETRGARIGNGNSRDSILKSTTLIEFESIIFSENKIQEVIVGGETIATDVDFLNEGSAISSMMVYQGHFGQESNIIVDGVWFRVPPE